MSIPPVRSRDRDRGMEREYDMREQRRRSELAPPSEERRGGGGGVDRRGGGTISRGGGGGESRNEMKQDDWAVDESASELLMFVYI